MDPELVEKWPAWRRARALFWKRAHDQADADRAENEAAEREARGG